MEESGYKKYFGVNLAELLADKIVAVYPSFNKKAFVKEIEKSVTPLELVDRVILISNALKANLPQKYTDALSIVLQILGPENEQETGMFTTGYWLWPVAKFVELYGLENFDESIEAIKEITKRHTGEYAIRPYIINYPEKTMAILKEWSKDKNVHVRRLATEGCRPRLPWAQKITLFITDPRPVFEILDNLKDDSSLFVRKSVANNMNDYLKDNKEAALSLLKKWKKEETKERQWVIKHALRNELKKENPEAIKLVE